MLRSAWLIAWKDLRASMRDRSLIAVALVAPLVLAFILSAVLPDEEFDVTYGFVDRDGGRLARVFERQVLERGVSEFAAVRTLDTRSDAIELAESDEVAAAFVIPEGFSETALRGQGATLEVIGNPASDVGAPIARSIADGFVREINSLGLSVATVAVLSGQAPDGDLVARVREAASEIKTPISVSQNDSESLEFDDKTFFAAGMAVFFLFFTVQLGASGLLREQRQGTLARLKAAPVTRSSILLGKALFSFVAAGASMLILVVAGTLLLGASFGRWYAVVAVVIAAVFAGMGVQTLVTAFAQTDEQAGAMGSVVAVTLGLLGGTFFPLSQAPKIVGSLSSLTPHAWIMRALGDLSGGGGTMSDIAPSLVALFVFGLVTMALALVLIRRRGVLS